MIYTVVFDSHGHILGGGFVQPGVEIEPHATVSFAIDDYGGLYPIRASHGAQARVSVDPCEIASYCRAA
jgi:hypothetical protein